MADEAKVRAPIGRSLLTTRNVLGSAFIVVLFAVFARPLMELATYAWESDLHSHIVLVPLISGYLIAIDWRRLPRFGRSSLVWGGLCGVVGVSALVLANYYSRQLSQNDRLAATGFSFVTFLGAGGFFFLGSRFVRAIAFPLAFLIFIVPLPDATVNWLETASKYASADAAALILRMTDIPMVREGVIFRLPGISLEVAQECSGIRSSWILFITSLLAAYLFLRSGWRRVVLVAFVLPLGIIRNGFRIAVIAWLCVHYGPQMIDHFIHRKGGPFFFALSLVPLFALLWWLRQSEWKRSKRGSVH